MKQTAITISSPEGAKSFRLHCTESAAERMRGLLGRSQLEEDEILQIKPCNSVHTFGMRYAIDVVFADRRGRITKIAHQMQPRRLSMSLSASQVFELSSGMARRLGLAAGQSVLMEKGATKP
jgi:uncharacterized membrane protein (UPF0127 family)